MKKVTNILTMKKVLFTLSIFCLFSIAQAQNEEVRNEHYNLTKQKIALNGYDPLSYFEKSPQEGKKEIAHTYKSVTYYFTSEKNKQSFIDSPEKYEPQYGGWCAYALSKDEPILMSTNPKSYHIKDGKLLMFFDKWYSASLLDKWIEDEEKLTKKANNAWGGFVEGWEKEHSK